MDEHDQEYYRQFSIDSSRFCGGGANRIGRNGAADTPQLTDTEGSGLGFSVSGKSLLRSVDIALSLLSAQARQWTVAQRFASLTHA